MSQLLSGERIHLVDKKGRQYALTLKAGETLRIVVEFNPVPMVYLLKAQGTLDVAYEKEGPDEWILRVTRTGPSPDKKQQFKELLIELKEGEVSQETKEKARTLLQEVDAKTLGVLEQELIREGISHDTIRKSLCDIHLDIMRDSLVAKRIAVEAPHPVHTFMEEHKVILENLRELAALVNRLRWMNSYAEMGGDLAKLQDIAHHLIEAEAHHLREEEALFPAIEKRDITEPPQIMREDHVEFRKRKQELYQLAHNPGGIGFPEFKARVTEHVLGKKIKVFTYKPKSTFKKTKGHRSRLTKLAIESITLKKPKEN